jgi:hypothetical protein
MLHLAPMPPVSIPVVAHTVQHCAWCWYASHPALSFPESWSSTCCPEHRVWVLGQLAKTKAFRQQASHAVTVAFPGVGLSDGAA